MTLGLSIDIWGNLSMDKPPKAKWETLITPLLYSIFLESRWEEISRNYLLLTIHYDETVKSICPCREVVLNALSNYKLWIYCKKTEKSWVSAWNMVQDQTWLYKMFAVLKMFWVRWSFWQEFLKCEHSKIFFRQSNFIQCLHQYH